MKKILTAFFALLGLFSFSQNAYYDALSIVKLDTIGLHRVLDHAKLHFSNDFNNFLPIEEIEFKLKSGEAIDNIEMIEIMDVWYVQYRKVGSAKSERVSTKSIKSSSKLREKFSLKDKAGEDVNVALTYVLSTEEVNQINNLLKFIRNPYDQSLVSIDLNVVYQAIDKYNAYAKKENFPSVSSRFGFIESLVSASVFDLLQRGVSGDFSMSGEDQTKILDGLVKYITEEFKRAQTASYMDVFERTIGKIGEFQILFPKTCAKLKSSDPTRFPDMGEELKEVFSQDFKAILDNLVKHIETHKADSPLESKLSILNYNNLEKIKAKSSYKSLSLAMDVSTKLIHNYHPVDLFHYLDETYYKKSFKRNEDSLHHKIGFILHGLNLLQRSLLDTTKSGDNRFSNVWLNYEQLRELNNPLKMKYFTGLIYQQDRAYFNELLFPDKNVNEIIKDVSLIQSEIEKKVNKIIPVLIELQNFRANLTEDNLKDNFQDYIRMVLDVAKNVVEDKGELDTFFILVDNVIDIYDNVRDKDYGNTIFHLNEILRIFLKDLDTNGQLVNILAKIDHYGSFMAAVVNAENSDDMKEVIKLFVAPSASYVFKRQHNWTFSVNAHPGYFVGFEQSKEFPELKLISGITLPVGLDLTYKLNRKSRGNSATFGVTSQLLDLGAILNFRVGDSTSTLPDKVAFEQFFSPGISFSYGFRNSPLTLNLGYQYTPELRKISLANGNELYPNYNRVSFRLSWDIPLLFIAKSKKYCKYD